jgi:hypothetical protein
LLENDYTFGFQKFGGNAQRIGGSRWLQHTSFLWDFDEDRMNQFLAFPDKCPQYRGKRTHAQFLCKLKERVNGMSVEEIVVEIRKSFANKLIGFAEMVDINLCYKNISNNISDYNINGVMQNNNKTDVKDSICNNNNLKNILNVNELLNKLKEPNTKELDVSIEITKEMEDIRKNLDNTVSI